MRSFPAVFALCCILQLTPAAAQTYLYQRDTPRLMTAHDRGLLRSFIIEHRFRQCGQNETAGLERCGLPSRVIMRYAPGSYLPQEVHDEVVPAGTAVQLAPAPFGAAYVYAGDNVYLMDVTSRRILDVVSLPAE